MNIIYSSFITPTMLIIGVQQYLSANPSSRHQQAWGHRSEQAVRILDAEPRPKEHQLHWQSHLRNLAARLRSPEQVRSHVGQAMHGRLSSPLRPAWVGFGLTQSLSVAVSRPGVSRKGGLTKPVSFSLGLLEVVRCQSTPAHLISVAEQHSAAAKVMLAEVHITMDWRRHFSSCLSYNSSKLPWPYLLATAASVA